MIKSLDVSACRLKETCNNQIAKYWIPFKELVILKAFKRLFSRIVCCQMVRSRFHHLTSHFFFCSEKRWKTKYFTIVAKFWILKISKEFWGKKIKKKTNYKKLLFKSIKIFFQNCRNSLHYSMCLEIVS